MIPAPIILFVYNRPWHTRQTVEALKKNELAAESELYIFSDGPRPDASEECLANIAIVRQYIHTTVGFKKVIIEESVDNIGLDNSILNGVSKILEKKGRAIVLEDDIVTHHHFLQYMNDCLSKYHKDETTYMVSGFSCNINFPPFYKKNIYMLHRPSSWGWGIWHDRWTNIIWDKAQLSIDNFTPKQIKKFNRGGNDLFQMYSSFYRDDIMPWDLRFAYNMYLNDAFCVYPRFSFVENIGLDGSGEHCGVKNSDLFRAPFPITYSKSMLPDVVKFNPFIEYRFKKFLKHN